MWATGHRVSQLRVIQVQEGRKVCKARTYFTEGEHSARATIGNNRARERQWEREREDSGVDNRHDQRARASARQEDN